MKPNSIPSQNTEQQFFHLDVYDMPANEAGLIDFSWPVSYDERDHFLKKAVQHYMSTVTAEQDDNYALSYKFAAKYFMKEAIAVFNADLIKHRLDAQNITPICKPEWRIWNSLLQDKFPEDPPFLKSWLCRSDKSTFNNKAKIFGKIKRVFSLLNLKGKGLKVGNLHLKRLSESVLKNDIITTQRTNLIQQHATKTDKDVVFCRSNRWFKTITDEGIKKSILNKDRDLEAKLLNGIKAIYTNEFHFEIPQNSLSYLAYIIEQTSARIRIHYERLLQAPDTLPVNVWTGTGGNIWDAMLRHASLMTHNGDITGHDHGAGLGHMNNPMMAFIELWGCKEFVCLNQSQANEMNKHANSWDYFTHTPPKMIGWGTNDTVQTFDKFKDPDFKIKNVILLISMTGGDRVWMGPCAPDPVLVDFYVKATAFLKENGYNVILKSHPELPPPPQTLIDMADEVRYEPLEDMMNECDLVLFDCIYTSVFHSVLATNIPMVVIDFFDHPWTDKGLELFQKRAEFINGHFDKDNKSDLNWNALKSSLKNSVTKVNNTEFFDFYYG